MPGTAFTSSITHPLPALPRPHSVTLPSSNRATRPRSALPRLLHSLTVQPNHSVTRPLLALPSLGTPSLQPNHSVTLHRVTRPRSTLPRLNFLPQQPKHSATRPLLTLPSLGTLPLQANPSNPLAPGMIRPALPSETDQLVALGLSTGLFTPEEADALLRTTLLDLHARRLPPRHQAHVYVEGGGTAGGAVNRHTHGEAGSSTAAKDGEAAAASGDAEATTQGGETGNDSCNSTNGVTGSALGWVYFAPEEGGEGQGEKENKGGEEEGRGWDLWWIGVFPGHQGKGVGRQLLAFVESTVRSEGGVRLTIETSSKPELEKTRRFYARQGYEECFRVKDSYGKGDDKVVFRKVL